MSGGVRFIHIQQHYLMTISCTGQTPPKKFQKVARRAGFYLIIKELENGKYL